MPKTLLFILSALILSACSSIKVTNDYDPAFSFDPVHTFAIIHQKRENSDTLTDDRIQVGIVNQLTQKGYRSTSRNKADVYVVFHTDVRNKTKIIQDYQYIGILPYSYGYGGMMAVPVNRTYNYDEGKLIVDILSSKNNKIVWRGVATDSLKRLKTPEERMAYINKVMVSIFKTLPSKVRPK